MHTFKNLSTSCQGQVNNCSCWSSLNNMTTAVKKCNIGKVWSNSQKHHIRLLCLAKDSESLLKTDYANCKQTFINCSKLEDAAIEYMVSCYTSITGVKENVKKLLQVQDATTKLKKNQENKINASTSARQRVKRQTQTCASYITQITTIETVGCNTIALTVILQFLRFWQPEIWLRTVPPSSLSQRLSSSSLSVIAAQQKSLLLGTTSQSWKRLSHKLVYW